MAGITLSELLKKMIEMAAATSISPRTARHESCARPAPAPGMPPLTAADTKSLAIAFLTDAQSTLRRKPGVDFSSA